MKRVGFLAMFLLLCVSVGEAQTITEKVKGLEKFSGFFTFY